MRAFVYRLGEGGPDVVQRVFEERGWVEYDGGNEDAGAEEGGSDAGGRWNVWWKVSRFRMSEMKSVRPWQRLNHFPKTHEITRKDRLTRNLRKMRAIHGAVYDFVPTTFILPNDYTKFVAAYTEDAEGDAVWICKPADLSRGRGIFLFRDINSLTYDSAAVVQRYVPNPLLIGGYKFDLRIYVAVTSFYPLCVYLYDEGLARFSTDKYSLDALGNIYSHLTNTSINKDGPGAGANKDSVGAGCKWTFDQLRAHFASRGVSDGPLWRRIEKIVVLTILALAPVVPPTDNCFELFGFDVLVDETLRPWLLEVNFSPALGTDCEVDWLVKRPLISDIIDLLDFTDADKVKVSDASSDDDAPLPPWSDDEPADDGAADEPTASRTASRTSVDRNPSPAAQQQTQAHPRQPMVPTRKPRAAPHKKQPARPAPPPPAQHAESVSSDSEVEEDIGASSSSGGRSAGTQSPAGSSSGSDCVVIDSLPFDGASDAEREGDGGAHAKPQRGTRGAREGKGGHVRLPEIPSPASSRSPESTEEDAHARSFRADPPSHPRDTRPLLQKRGSVPVLPRSNSSGTLPLRAGRDRHTQSHSDLFGRRTVGGLHGSQSLSASHPHGGLVALPSLAPRGSRTASKGTLRNQPQPQRPSGGGLQYRPDRERVGKFKRIFPYDDATAKMCVQGKPVDVRAVVAEIKNASNRRVRAGQSVEA